MATSNQVIRALRDSIQSRLPWDFAAFKRVQFLNNTVRGKILSFLLLTGIIFACSPLPHLNVTYRLPFKTDELKGKTVYLDFQDDRDVEDIIGGGAKKEFAGFSGNISYSLARGNEEGFKIGVFEIPALFKEVFKKRLEYLGITVTPEKRKEQVALVIVLKELVLDLFKRKWMVKMGYEARLVIDGEALSIQTISGQAERLKVVGTKQADIVLTELFTDLVNRLDIPRLFQKGGF